MPPATTGPVFRSCRRSRGLTSTPPLSASLKREVPPAALSSAANIPQPSAGGYPNALTPSSALQIHAPSPAHPSRQAARRGSRLDPKDTA